MADEIQNPAPDQAPAEGTTAAPARPVIMKYLVFGLAGLVLVVGVAFVTLLFTGGAQTTSDGEKASESHADLSGEATEAQPTDEQILDSLLAGEADSNVLKMIEENLAALDYEPEASELGTGTAGMSEKDSLDAVDWLTKEKKRLAEWEEELTDRQKELAGLEQEVTKKILRIEQAESARIASLARLYDGMDSRAVARLMANLDDETVVSILPRMKAKNASQVLQLLPSQRAAKLSKQMITIAGS